jgi:hypothetical protein
MKEGNKGQGRPYNQEPTGQQAGGPEQQTPQQRGQGIRGVPPPGEQQPQGGGTNKPELHPPEEEISELARENDKFFRKLRRLTEPASLGEDFYKRLRERLKNISQSPPQTLIDDHTDQGRQQGDKEQGK